MSRAARREQCEVVVVGGGPGGAATAHYVAARGRRVILLDRHRFPRDKSCGDALTRRAVRVLGDMGALPSLRGSQRISGVRVEMRGKGTEDFEYPKSAESPEFGLVVPRRVLDDAILRRAEESGTEVWQGALATELLVERGVVQGVRARRDGEELEIRAPVTVIAAGSASRLIRDLDRSGGSERLGFAVRAYLHRIDGLDDRLEIYAPVLDASDRYILPSYGWLFPLDRSSANFGIGLFEKLHGANLRQMAEQFLAERRELDPRLRSARLSGPWKGAPLRFDFSPERCAGPGVVLVGDAAGLVSPFTGEGISYALESARLAAGAIDRSLRPGRDDPPDLSEYSLLMGRHYTGYFEAGRHSARRYLLAWHVLEDTFKTRGPIFSLARRAIFLPEELGELYASHVLDDVSALISPGLKVREGLVAVGEVLLDVVRREWPFLGLTWLGGHGDPGIPFRPALLVLLGAHLGDADAPRIATVAAALELGYLAALAQLSLDDEAEAQRPTGTAANWGNLTAVILADFLLTRAYLLSARAGAAVSRLITAGMDQACRGEVEALRLAFDPSTSESRHLTILDETTAPVFSLPCRLGALLGDAPKHQVEAVATYGRHMGMAYRIADDALQLAGRHMTVGTATGLDVRRGVYSLGVLRAANGTDSEEELRRLLRRRRLDEGDLAELFELVRAGNVLPGVLVTARRYAERAKASLVALPAGPVRRSLERLADFAVTREAGQRRNLETVFDARDGQAPGRA